MSTTNTLSRSITASQTSIPLNTSIAIFPQQGGVVSIGSEQIQYSVASEDGIFGCVRGFNSTTPATATQGAVVTLVSTTAVTQNFSGSVTSNAGDPVNAQDLATKHYVDTNALEITTPISIANGGTNSGTALAGNKAIVSNGSAIVEATTTSTELGYVHGVTSAIQTQLNPLLTFLGSLAADPGSPTEGQIWYNTTTHLLKYYNGTAIKTVTAS